MKFDKKELSKRFWELEDARAEVEKKTSPLKAERDKLMAKVGPDLAKAQGLGKEVKALERDMGLAEIDKERAFISRGLGGRVGPRS